MPLARAENDLKHVCLAAGVEDCGQIPDFISDIVNILGDCLDLKLEWRQLMSAFAISSLLKKPKPVRPRAKVIRGISHFVGFSSKRKSSLCSK